MAITGIPHDPKQMRVGIAQQAVWGTAIADAAEFDEISVEPVEVDYDIREIEVSGSHGSRNANDSDVVSHTNGCMPKISLSGIANKNIMDHFLYGAIQNVTEADTTPFLKTFTLPDSQPDFKTIAAITEAGHISTIILRDPTAAHSVKLVDCVCKSLKLNWAKGDVLRYTADMVGRGNASHTSDPSGTWTRPTASDLFHWNKITTVTIGGTAFRIEGLELTIAHDVQSNSPDGAGSFNDLHFGGRQLDFKVKVVKDADWATILTNWKGNTAQSFIIQRGDGSGTEDIGFTFRGKPSASTGAQKIYDQLVNGEITGKMLESADGGTAPLSILLSNAIDRTWVSA